jgi:hypothetical protein
MHDEVKSKMISRLPSASRMHDEVKSKTISRFPSTSRMHDEVKSTVISEFPSASRMHDEVKSKMISRFPSAFRMHDEVKSKMISRVPSASRMHDEASAQRMHDDKNYRAQTVLKEESTEIPSRVMLQSSHEANLNENSPDVTSSGAASNATALNENPSDVTTSDAVYPSTLCSVLVNDGIQVGKCQLALENPPSKLENLLSLPTMSHKRLMKEIRSGKIEQLCVIINNDDHVENVLNCEQLRTSSSMDIDVLDDKTRIERYEAQSWDALKDNPLYDDLRDFKDVFPDQIPCELPKDKGIRHEIDLVPGTKYNVTRQWPLPREQVKVIDDFFEQRLKAGHVRESTSPHCSPTFCVKKATGGWRIVHAFNKLNAATIPAQTPIPRKDVIIDGMQGSTIFSTIDLTDGFYQILMRVKDIPFTAVSTPSGMLWEWLVMPQGLSNAPATFNRCITHLLRPVRDFASSYFDGVYIHSRAAYLQLRSA